MRSSPRIPVVLRDEFVGEVAGGLADGAHDGSPLVAPGPGLVGSPERIRPGPHRRRLSALDLLKDRDLAPFTQADAFFDLFLPADGVSQGYEPRSRLVVYPL